LAGDGGVDPDDLAGRVHQRAARVARVDGGVGLQDAVEPLLRFAVRTTGIDRAVERGDDAARHRRTAGQRERIADGDDVVTHLRLVRVAERNRLQSGGIDLEHREIGRRVAPEYVRVEHPAADGEGDLDVLGPGDDMVVGDDDAVRVDDETGARTLLR